MSNAKRQYVLGIDTSNYTTSIAIIDDKYNVVRDKRLQIKVKPGTKGIRQSEALFQHNDNLPVLIEDILSQYREYISAVCVSSKPRPTEESYMPVFKSGINYGKLIAYALDIPIFFTSHQEGHIEAGIYSYWQRNNMEKDNYPQNTEDASKITAFHLSGGTTEILHQNQIIGGSLDLSLGQLLDRMGNYMDIDFPAGRYLDQMVCKYMDENNMDDFDYKRIRDNFKDISTKGLYFNLSGLDTQIKRMVETMDMKSAIENIVLPVFILMSRCLKSLTMDLKKQYNIEKVLYVGGVSSSRFIKDYLKKEIDDGIELCFAEPDLSVDNGVGVALLGGKKLWQ